MELKLLRQEKEKNKKKFIVWIVKVTFSGSLS